MGTLEPSRRIYSSGPYQVDRLSSSLRIEAELIGATLPGLVRRLTEPLSPASTSSRYPSPRSNASSNGCEGGAMDEGERRASARERRRARRLLPGDRADQRRHADAGVAGEPATGARRAAAGQPGGERPPAAATWVTVAPTYPCSTAAGGTPAQGGPAGQAPRFTSHPLGASGEAPTFDTRLHVRSSS
jgi:hypothetical protein